MERVTGVWGSCGIREVFPARGLLEVNLKKLLDGKVWERHFRGGYSLCKGTEASKRIAKLQRPQGAQGQRVLREETSSWGVTHCLVGHLFIH